MGYARLLISPSVVRHWIPLPDTTTIHGDGLCGHVVALLEDEQFPCKMAVEAPVVEALFRKTEAKVEFVGYRRRGDYQR